MDEREFNTFADAMLARIERALESSAADLDFEIKPGGVIELEFDHGGGSKIIINRHTAAREIWIAAKSGGYHFKADSSDPLRWLGTRDGVDLAVALSRCISEQAGVVVKLDI
ncbi:MAG: iron donor protein CyaY [Betaproteobacteria bacterium]|nr:iron donor protein CyaY [Betaproteobacteria bacterium]